MGKAIKRYDGRSQDYIGADACVAVNSYALAQAPRVRQRQPQGNDPRAAAAHLVTRQKLQ